jgi:hypothetical protein
MCHHFIEHVVLLRGSGQSFRAAVARLADWPTTTNRAGQSSGAGRSTRAFWSALADRTSQLPTSRRLCRHDTSESSVAPRALQIKQRRCTRKSATICKEPSVVTHMSALQIRSSERREVSRRPEVRSWWTRPAPVGTRLPAGCGNSTSSARLPDQRPLCQPLFRYSSKASQI